MTFDEAVSRSPLRPFHWAVVAVCMLVLVADGVDLQLLGLVAPLVIDEWGVDRGSFGWAMSAALVGMAFGAWGGGYLGDRLGRRNALIWAALLFGSATIAASTSDTIAQMTAWRMIGGLGFGAAFPNSLALASEWLPERWRPYAITTLSVGTPAGGSVAAAVAPALLDAYAWRGTFVFFGLATLLLIIPIILVLRDSPSFLFQKGQEERARKYARKILSASVQLTAGKSVAADKVEESVGVFHAQNRRMNWGIAIGFAASTLVAYSVISWGTTFLTVAGLTMDQALTASFFVGISSIAGALAAGFLTRRFGSKSVLIGTSATLLAVAIGLALLLETRSGTPSPAMRVSIQALVVTISGVVSVGIATIYVMMTLGYQQSCRSAGIGFGMLVGRVGAIATSLAGGYLIDLGAGSLLPFFTAIAIGAILIGLSAFIVDRHTIRVARA